MANSHRRIIAYILWAGCAVIIVHMVSVNNGASLTERLINFASHWVFVIVGIATSVEIYEPEQ